MNHYLATVNEEATLQPDPSDLPGIGSRIVFVPRGGIRRDGRVEFPADVMRIRPEGTLDIFVTYDKDEQLIEEHVPRLSDVHTFGWKPVDNPPEILTEPSRLNELRRDLDQLRDDVHGEFDPSGKAVVQHLADFDERLRAMEAHLNVSIDDFREQLAKLKKAKG